MSGERPLNHRNVNVASASDLRAPDDRTSRPPTSSRLHQTVWDTTKVTTGPPSLSRVVAGESTEHRLSSCLIEYPICGDHYRQLVGLSTLLSDEAKACPASTALHLSGNSHDKCHDAIYFLVGF